MNHKVFGFRFPRGTVKPDIVCNGGNDVGRSHTMEGDNVRL